MSAAGSPVPLDRQVPVVRALGPDDLERVHAIEVEVSPAPWSASLFADELQGDGLDRHWLVTELAGQVVGFGGLMIVADEAHIMNVAVDPRHQRTGVAARLVAGLLLEAGDRGSIAATLEVRVSNLAAKALYRRFRFEEAGIRPRYYPDGEDAAIMWAHRIYDAQYRRLLADERSKGGDR